MRVSRAFKGELEAEFRAENNIMGQKTLHQLQFFCQGQTIIDFDG